MMYKIPDGKPENKFTFSCYPKDAEFALKIVNKTHKYWKNLLQKKNINGLSRYGYINCRLFLSLMFYIFIKSTKNFSVNTSLNNTFTIGNEKVQAILSECLPLSEPRPLLNEGKYIYFIRIFLRTL